MYDSRSGRDWQLIEGLYEILCQLDAAWTCWLHRLEADATKLRAIPSEWPLPPAQYSKNPFAAFHFIGQH